MPEELFSFTIPAGHSNCAHCYQFKECRNKVFNAFENPIPAQPEYGLPECTGVWSMWCDDCVTETGVEHEREEDPQRMRIVVVENEKEDEAT